MVSLRFICARTSAGSDPLITFSFGDKHTSCGVNIDYIRAD